MAPALFLSHRPEASRGPITEPRCDRSDAQQAYRPHKQGEGGEVEEGSGREGKVAEGGGDRKGQAGENGEGEGGGGEEGEGGEKKGRDRG